nr:hypothetical protein [Tanacetum cinerariifolium]
MSDLNESGVTYADVSGPFEELSDIGSPRADDHEHLELPEMLEDPYVEVAFQAPPSPDYIPGPEEPEQAPPSPDYVPCPEHADDEIVAEDQPYAEDASPTGQSPEYVPDSDIEAHPEDDDDEDPEEDPADEEEEEEEEEHPAPADSVVVALTAADQVLSAEETKPFETDESTATPPPHPAYRMTARISIPAPVFVPAWSDSEVVRLLAMSSPPLRPPFILSPTRSDAPSSGPPLLLPISTSTSSPPLQLPSASRREDRPEVTLPHRKRLGIAFGPGYEVGKSSSVAAAARPARGLRADYGFVATMDREITRDPEREARLSREAWVRSTEASDLVRGEVMSLRTTILGQMTEIRELHAADRRRQIVISEMLRADHMRSTEIIGLRTDLQGQVTALQG